MRLSLDAVPSSIRVGRRWAVQAAGSFGASRETIRILELLTSELVTNSVKYGPPGGTITLEARRQGSALRLIVSDESVQAPVVRELAFPQIGGHGLRLVESLATDWGVDVRQGDGKSVWMELTL